MKKLIILMCVLWAVLIGLLLAPNFATSVQEPNMGFNAYWDLGEHGWKI